MTSKCGKNPKIGTRGDRFFISKYCNIRRRGDEERETRRQERELRRLEMEADIMRQKEAAEVAKRQHELELARLGQ